MSCFFLYPSSQYEPRNISDHSLFWVELIIPSARKHFCWKLNSFRMSLFPDADPLPNLITTFFHYNVDTADLGVVWDTAKEYLQGHFIHIITNNKTTTKAWGRFNVEIGRTEEAYIANPSGDTKRAWLAAKALSRQVELQLAENKCFFLQQKHFEEGETTVRSKPPPIFQW